MIRLFAIAIGAFFALGLLWSFGNGAYSYVTQPPAETVEHAFHVPPRPLRLASDGPFGNFDRQQLQRGFAVYKQVCSACHSLRHVAFRDLQQLGYSPAEVKAIAKGFQIPVFNSGTGELTTRPGLPTDHFPPVAYAGQGTPPDLSLITKARHEGPAYVHSLLTGFRDQPADLLKRFPDSKTPNGLFYNPYFANLNIAMPPPLTAEGQVTYSDGTKATVDQMATDVSAFLVWTAEPSLAKRHQTGVWVVLYFLIATIIAYLAYRNVWRDKKH